MIETMYSNGTKVCRKLSQIKNVLDCDGINVTVISVKNPPEKAGNRSSKTEEPLCRDIITILDILEAPDVSLSRDITPYDICIMDAVYTISKNGCNLFSPETVIRLMDGWQGTDISPARTERVVKSIRKLSSTLVRIRCDAEFAVRGIDGDCVLESNLVSVVSAAVKCKNQKMIRAYKLLCVPVLYQYAEKIGQIISYPVSLLGPTPVPNSGPAKHSRRGDVDEFIVLQQYIIKRIETMRNPKNHLHSNRIGYDWMDGDAHKGLFPDLGIDISACANPRKKRTQIHNKVKTILDRFVEKGYINGYAEYRAADSKRMAAPIAGVKIDL